MYKLLFFSPSQGTTQLLLSLKSSWEFLDFDIISPETSNSDSGLDQEEQAIREGRYSGVCACKDLYRYFSAFSSLIPVFEIPLSDCDIRAALSPDSGHAASYAVAAVPGYEALNQLLRQVKAFFRQQEQLRLSSRLLEQYMGASGQSILIYTADHSLIYSIHMEKLEKLQDIARSLIDTVLQSRTLSQTRTLASRTYYLRGTRITWESQDYVVFEIRRSLENKVTLIPGVIIKNQENISTDFYSLFYDYLTNPDFLSRAAAYSEASNPVMIIGESGTGKSRLADFVYSHSPYRQSSLVLIDCKQLDKRGLHLLFQSSQSPLYEYGITLYLKEINLLKRKYTEQLVDFLMQSTFLKKNKMIFSVTCSLSEAGEDRLCQQLISRLNAFPLYLSPLRDRAGDIPKLCLQYLNQLNQNSPKQVTGFEPEAMNYLQSFYWDENVKQLKRVLEELFAMTRTPYICAKDVVSVLRENKGAPPSSFCPAEEGPLTLDQIIQKGVRRSLIANQMNHTKTAKELGISRTALWRLLKKSSNKRGCEE